MSNIIIGNGQIARAFSVSRSSDFLFFCSGVSNSNEKRQSEFIREYDLFTTHSQTEKVFVYFSSVMAPSKINSYYKHKIFMENKVRSDCTRYLIVRLPQVVGAGNNKTLFGFFVENIKNENKIYINSRSVRSLIDVDDVVKIFDHVVASEKFNYIIDFLPPYTFTPLELFDLISKKINKKSSYEIVDANESMIKSYADYGIDKFVYLLGDPNTYLERLVDKYIDKY